ncbi:MAG: isocitrate lyase/phosphoenolpyruvate mutase family protein [Saprospiraceae bacterium]|nr:isocitrate lyase/phosphoenolpyruvate mutase family protein [Saprospiraceae bacterium]
MKFPELHLLEKPLLICNVWDVASAKVAEDLGFEAIATSSGAIASMLGYRDGEEMTFPELYYVLKRITDCVKLPLSVDMEAGYSRDPQQIATYLHQLLNLGVVGINLEDSLVEKERYLLEGEQFARHLESIIANMGEQAKSLFINIRTDGFLLGHKDALQKTIERAHLYQAAGADGLFVPCIQNEEDIRQISQHSALPLNVMCMPELPSFRTLGDLGVKRISMGNFVHTQMLKQIKISLTKIKEYETFTPLFQ